MPRDIEVQDAAKIMADDKEAVEDAEVQRWDRKEVHRSDCFTMIAQERKPAFSGFGASRRFAHPAGDGSLGNVEAEHEKLAMIRGAPQVGFSATILKIRSRTSLEVPRLPPRGRRTLDRTRQ
jgi:hypothetical protein